MLFHLNHGTSIQLQDGQSTARRDESQLGNGIVFSDNPLKVNQRVCIELGCSTAWSGAIRVGVTSQNPARLTQEELPSFAYPDFHNKDGYWVRVINENLTSHGCHLMLYLNSYGHLQLFINGQHKGVLLQNLSVTRSLWLLFDIYGNTVSAKFITPDNVPVEIQARGPEAVDAYEQACTFGTQPVHRTRLMLVGKEKAGKTSLKRALTGQSHDSLTESTDGIDLTASCSFSAKNPMNPASWKMSVKGDETVRRERLQDSVDLAVLGGIEGLEEEYNRAVANNIVQEMLFKRKQITQQSEQPSEASPASHSNSAPASLATPSPATTSASSLCKVKVAEEIQGLGSVHESIPDRVVTLVMEILAKKEKAGNKDDVETTKPPAILNIWDFSGHSIYYTTHQVFLSSRAVYCFVFNLCDSVSITDGHQTNEKVGFK